MSTNGNGKVDPRIMQAQRQLLKAQEPLKELDAKLAACEQQLTATNKSLDIWNAEHASYGEAFADDDSAHNRQQLLNAARQVEVHTTKIKVLNDRIATLQAQRAVLDAAVQQASTVLSEATTEVRLQALEQEMATHKYHIAQHETAIRERTKLYNAAEAEYKQMLRSAQDAKWEATRRQAREHHLKTNGPTPGYERTRVGF